MGVTTLRAYTINCDAEECFYGEDVAGATYTIKYVREVLAPRSGWVVKGNKTYCSHCSHFHGGTKNG